MLYAGCDALRNEFGKKLSEDHHRIEGHREGQTRHTKAEHKKTSLAHSESTSCRENVEASRTLHALEECSVLHNAFPRSWGTS
jgi:hypothetical protein